MMVNPEVENDIKARRMKGQVKKIALNKKDPTSPSIRDTLPRHPKRIYQEIHGNNVPSPFKKRGEIPSLT